MGINNPAQSSGFFSVVVAPIMALATKGRKKFIAAQPLSYAPCLVVDVLAFGFFAPLAHLVESQVGLLNFCVLLVFTLAFVGCAPQPSAAFEALQSFKGSF
tara:strand:+ start:1581 stop:1883 length:303 start_codon:yes stop_codon:yes gene_type:complete